MDLFISEHGNDTKQEQQILQLCFLLCLKAYFTLYFKNTLFGNALSNDF